MLKQRMMWVRLDAEMGAVEGLNWWVLGAKTGAEIGAFGC